jgi:MoxR-like ATPase
MTASDAPSARRPKPLDAEALRLGQRMREVTRELDARFLDKGEIVRLMLVTLLAGEHMLLVGPPGTAKSALVRHLSRLVEGRFFEYLLTRFTEPNELFGPVDIQAFREGRYVRRVESMLPDAEIVFLDEVFKSSSAILNSLLSILNERRFFTGSTALRVPLCSLYGATNDIPNDEALGAVFDRFLVRVVSDNLDSFHFHGLVERGISAEIAEREGSGSEARGQALLSLSDVRRLQKRFGDFLQFPEEFLATYKSLVFQIRSEGVTISDRRVVKLLKLFAASAILDGRPQVHDGDFFILRHVWNSPDQVTLLEDIVGPILERHHRERPEERRGGPASADLDVLLTELGVIREALLGGESLSDVQLFSQLRNLQDIRGALQSLGTETAQKMVGEVDRLLEGVFESSRWNG